MLSADTTGELRFLHSTAFPEMRDDVNALDNSSSPNHLKWLDSLAATRVAVGVLCGCESGGSAEDSI
jgi:hypothetical protein